MKILKKQNNKRIFWGDKRLSSIAWNICTEHNGVCDFFLHNGKCLPVLRMRNSNMTLFSRGPEGDPRI
jgi:hypothetical protein